jgi:branched-chain amino acid transport system ATP-binding protein
MSEDVLLATEGLCTYYGTSQALFDVGIKVPSRGAVAILGRNGAGKTTLLKTIAGIVTAQPGSRILLNETAIEGEPPHRIVAAGIALVPEGRRLFGDMTVIENLKLGAYTEHARANEAHQLERQLATFPRLAERRNQLAKTMSGGEQQMLALGMALMTRPKWLLLDEPFTGLAPIIIEAVMKRLLEVNARYGTGLLIVEQNVPITLKAVERAVILKAGRMVFEGPAHELEAQKDLWQWF